MLTQHKRNRNHIYTGTFGYNRNSGSLGDYCHANDSTGFGGTSSATPLAVGVAALILSVRPEITACRELNVLAVTTNSPSRLKGAFLTY